MTIALIVSFTVSGWITGAVGTLGFNLLAIQLGGIDASVVTLEKRDGTNEEDLPPVI